MRDTRKMEPSLDMSLGGVQDAIVELGAICCEKEAVLIYSEWNYGKAIDIAEAVGCGVALVPEAMLKTRETWGVYWRGQTIWSEGIR